MITNNYVKNFARLTAAPDKPFRFASATIMEADENSWYKDLVGTTQVIYLHGYEEPVTGIFEVHLYCAYEQIKPNRIEIIGKFKKEHLDI